VGTLWKIALRNTVRHARRTIITAVVMMGGIAVFIFYDSLLAGLDRMAVDTMESYTLSSLKIRTPAYVQDIQGAPLDKGLAHPEETLAVVTAQGLQATQRIRFVARLSNYTDEIPVLADAVDPAADPKVFRLAQAVTEGAWLSRASPHSVVLGAELARELSLNVGDTVLVTAQTVHDVTNADEYTVAGLLSTPAPEVNRGGLFMPLDEARALLDTPAGPGALVTEVDVALPRAPSLAAALAQGEAAASRLRAALPAERIDPIGSLAAGYLALRNAKASYSLIPVIIVLMIAAVGIVNTILMSVFSRVREIGVLRAYGMTARDIKRLFTLEGLALGLAGSTLGVALGAALDLLLVVRGVSMGSLSQSLGSLPISGVLHGEWNPKTMIIGFLFGVVVSLIAARIPARRASRLQPTDALRFQ
jgi:putative ABC transport system permease protein